MNVVRINRLRALVEHPRTGESERAAAQRMLERILAKTTPAPTGERNYGERHHRGGRHERLDAVAELIRDDIRFARKGFGVAGQAGELAVSDPVADAPGDIEFTVDLPFEGSIVVTLERIPRDWGWTAAGEVSPALRRLAEEVATIMNAYNHSGPDIGPRFFAKVRTEQETLIF